MSAAMTAQPRPRTTLSEHAYDMLRAMIVRGEMAPEQRLSEPDLTERLNIGRTPLREAVLRLAQDGLVAIYPQSGSFVAPISLTQLEEAQFVRERLECGIIRRVTERADRPALAGLRSLIRRQQQASDEVDIERFHRLDEELHESFCAIAGWPDVWRLIHRSKVHMDRVRRMSLPLAGQMPHLILQHRAILDAVVAGNADAAEAAMRGHLREIFSTVSLLQLDRHPEQPETGTPLIRAAAAGPTKES
jgi:GntR family transcriptional regulator, rspAB operon transcriptional repressor